MLKKKSLDSKMKCNRHSKINNKSIKMSLNYIYMECINLTADPKKGLDPKKNMPYTKLGIDSLITFYKPVIN